MLIFIASTGRSLDVAVGPETRYSYWTNGETSFRGVSSGARHHEVLQQE